VADVLKPVLDPLMTSIAGLAKKPAKIQQSAAGTG
jgi:hypothetical protein